MLNNIVRQKKQGKFNQYHKMQRFQYYYFSKHLSRHLFMQICIIKTKKLQKCHPTIYVVP